MDRKWWTLVAVCVGTFMLLLDVTIVNVALPAIQTSLKASFSDLQWVVDAYSLMLAALLLTTGSLADLFGRRRVFMIGLVIFSVSSLLSGAGDDAVVAEPRPGRPGRRRGGDVLDLAGAARQRLSGPRARGRVRCLGGDHRPRGGDRAGDGRRADHGPVVALDLPRQRPDRRGRAGAVRVARRGVPAARRAPARFARRRHLQRRARRAGLRADQGRAEGLGIDRDPGLPDRRGRAAGRVRDRRAGSARPGDVRPRPVSQADLHRRVDRRLRALGRACSRCCST